MTKIKKSPEKKSGGILAKIERVGNALPHPAIIFVIMIAILAVIAQICASADSYRELL